MGEALDIFRNKTVTPSGMSSREWARVDAAIRTKSFFSAKVEDARLLQRLYDLLDGMMGGKAGAPRSKSQFIEHARIWMKNEGMLKSMPLPGDGSTQKDRDNWQWNVRHHGSMARLGLIFETQMKSIHSQARWERGMSPNLLAAFPAARFVRTPGAKTKRIVHVANEGVVRLKTDFQFWAMEMNSRELGGFEVPWAPYGYNSYMDTVDVSSGEAERLGIYDRNNPPKLSDTSVFGSDASKRYGEESQVSIAKLTPDIRAKLIAELKKRTTVKLVQDDLLKLTPKPELRRPEPVIMPRLRPIADLNKTDKDKGKPQDGSIKIETEKGEVQGERSLLWACKESRKIINQLWGKTSLARETGIILQAQVSAVVKGKKPLYIEPLGDHEELIKALSSAMPKDCFVDFIDNHVVVGNKKLIQSVLSNRHGLNGVTEDNIIKTITPIIESGDSGYLLGYGAKNYKDRPAFRIDIIEIKTGNIIMGFFTSKFKMIATIFAKKRLNDFSSKYKTKLTYVK